MRIFLALVLLVVISGCRLLPVNDSREIHVAVSGKDSNSGSTSEPLKTIQAAAELAQPGDTVIVHAGTYRERIDPPRGGISDAERIVYQAASCEKVVITGAEPVKGWVKVTNDTWQVVLPNTFFGQYNPYSDIIHGDWCHNKGGYHTGAVYLNGDWLTETTKKDEILRPAGSQALWFASVDAANTTIQAQFKGTNPNEQDVEINVRKTVFTPSKTGVDYPTVRGFELRAAATQWAPPTAAQTGIISAYWCKGWIIEKNRIAYSPCCGIALGKYGDEWDNGESIKDQPEWLKKEMQGGTGGYVATTERALKNGWNKATVGSHLVRDNEISNCEQTGIVGSLGCAYSVITRNDIHDIHVRNLYGGYEMAGIKFHGPIDVVISSNHIYRTGNRSGIWLDWMGQGSQIVGNLLRDNDTDVFLEMQHGPILVANNLLLSRRAVELDSQGMAFVHNLIAGTVRSRVKDDRTTPFQKPHDTAIAGMHPSPKGDSGDHRFHNNIMVAPCDLKVLDKSALPCFASGNVYTKGAQPSKFDKELLIKADFDPGINLTQEKDGWYLNISVDPAWKAEQSRRLITTELLGSAVVTVLPFENPDGSPVRIDTDYLGKKRDEGKLTAGPLEASGSGPMRLKVR